VSGPWDFLSWGATPSGALALDDALALDENVVRLAFGKTVFFSGLLDPRDASDPSKYTVVPVMGGVGLDGEAVRAVSVVAVELPTIEELPSNDVGRFVDLVLDRPMSAWPTRYTAAVSNVYSADLLQQLASAARAFDAAFKEVQPPQFNNPRPARDIGNAPGGGQPVGIQAGQIALGTFAVGADGDYAFDEGDDGLKKRIVRRLLTIKNRFAHLLGYGVGVTTYGKQLVLASTLARVTADAEAQIRLEPEVAQARVRVVLDEQHPELVRFIVAVRTRDGAATRFDVPVPLSQAA